MARVGSAPYPFSVIQLKASQPHNFRFDSKAEIERGRP